MDCYVVSMEGINTKREAREKYTIMVI